MISWQYGSLFVLASLVFLSDGVLSFAPGRRGMAFSPTSLAAFSMTPPPTVPSTVTNEIVEQQRILTTTSSSSPSVDVFRSGAISPKQILAAKDNSGLASSSTHLSLQPRKIPTKEEIEAKKRTFNLIFWGGGFVAPLLSTIFYFGFKFWEK